MQSFRVDGYSLGESVALLVWSDRGTFAFSVCVQLRGKTRVNLLFNFCNICSTLVSHILFFILILRNSRDQIKQLENTKNNLTAVEERILKLNEAEKNPISFSYGTLVDFAVGNLF